MDNNNELSTQAIEDSKLTVEDPDFVVYDRKHTVNGIEHFYKKLPHRKYGGLRVTVTYETVDSECTGYVTDIVSISPDGIDKAKERAIKNGLLHELPAKSN